MNSVMEIGEIFLKNGLKAWQGTKEEIFKLTIKML
jgi:phospholipid/cholesterol/gamma-HCH transport system ATP-binding protein